MYIRCVTGNTNHVPVMHALYSNDSAGDGGGGALAASSARINIREPVERAPPHGQ